MCEHTKIKKLLVELEKHPVSIEITMERYCPDCEKMVELTFTKAGKVTIT